MRQRGIQISSLLRYLQLGLYVLRIANLSHQVHAIGNHYQYHTHILGKREQQISEVLALHRRVFIIQLLYTVQTMQYARHRCAVFLLYLIQRNVALLYLRYQLYSLYRIAFQTDFLSQDLGRLRCHSFSFLVCKCEFFRHNFQILPQRYIFLSIN